MNNKESEFQNLLIEKYGEDIVNKLYDNGRLHAENIQKQNEASQALVAGHMNSIFKKLGKTDVNDWIEKNYKHAGNIENENKKWDKKSWAFDFSGWLGALDFNKEHVKKYMVVGLEPHVERYDF